MYIYICAMKIFTYISNVHEESIRTMAQRRCKML